MIPVNIVIEDDLSKEMIRILLRQSGTHLAINMVLPDLKRELASPGYSYIKKNIARFNRAARVTPFIVLTDLDKNDCAPNLIREWLPYPRHNNLMFRVAVREVEAWVMADRAAFAAFIGLGVNRLPLDSEQLDDPKKFLINLVKSCRKKDIKIAILPGEGSTATIGPNYNGCLIGFLQKQWRLEEAIKHSNSLKRMAEMLKDFRPD